MKRLKKLVSLLLVVVLCVTMTSTAFAKNVCVNISGNSSKETTFTVVTGSSWKNNAEITFTQSKGTITYNNFWGSTSSVKTYGAYTVSYICLKNNGASSTGYGSWSYTKTYKMKLQKNATYIITVTPVNTNKVFEHCRDTKTLVSWKTYCISKRSASYYKPYWSTCSTWNVKSTSVVSSCTKN